VTQPSTDGSELWEPVSGANVPRLAQTASDPLRVLPQVRGSPFDSAGLGSMDLVRFASKGSGVRFPQLHQAKRGGNDLETVG